MAERKDEGEMTMSEAGKLGAEAAVERSWAHRKREAGDLAGDPKWRGNVAPVNVQHALRGIDYPATKDDLVAKAEENGASEDVLEVVRRLGRDEYGGPQDVMKAYGELTK